MLGWGATDVAGRHCTVAVNTKLKKTFLSRMFTTAVDNVAAADNVLTARYGF